MAIAFAIYFIVIWFASATMGIGTSPDSASFLSTAESIREGSGLEDYTGKASQLSPPGYPIAVAATSLLTFRDVRFGAPRLLAAVAFGLFGALTYLVLRSLSASEAIGAIGLIAVLSNVDFVYQGAHALSDVPFLVLSIAGGMLFLAWYRSRREWLLWLSGLIFSAALLTRYVGIVWPATLSVWLLFDSLTSNFGERLRRASTFVLLTVGPLILWVIVWLFWEPQPGGRTLSWHPIEWERMVVGFETLGRSLGGKQGAIGWVMIAVAVALYIFSRRPGQSPGYDSGTNVGAISLSLKLLASVAISYFLFLMISISLFDRGTPLDGRMLAPASWALTVMFLLFVGSFISSRKRIAAFMLPALFIYFMWRFLFEVVPAIADWNRYGLNLSHRDIQFDRAIKWVRNYANPTEVVLSNTPWIIFLATRKNATSLPWKYEYTSGLPNDNYSMELLTELSRWTESGALIVMDRDYFDEFNSVTKIEELEAMGLQPDPALSSDRFLVYRSRDAQ